MTLARGSSTVVATHLALAALLTIATALAQADAPGVTWSGKIEVAAGGGYQGPWRMNNSTYDFVDDPTVAIDEQGVVAVAWADQSRKDIFLQL